MQIIVKKLNTFYALAGRYRRGWKCRDNIVVFESDDWGVLRTPSKEVYHQLIKSGYRMERSPVSADSLESEGDLAGLFSVLTSYKDRYGRNANFTANFAVSNPDFSAIKKNYFMNYYPEPLLKTLQRYRNAEKILALYKEGSRSKIFIPQFHCREHVRWWKWLEALRKKDKAAHSVFEYDMAGFPKNVASPDYEFDGPIYVSQSELTQYGIDMAEIIRDGLEQFEKLFGCRSKTTIAPNYCWTPSTENAWKEHGICAIQGSQIQLNGNGRQTRSHYTGDFNDLGQCYLVRNCLLEPHGRPYRSIEKCLHQVHRAFRAHMPAIICSHRNNYIASINQSIRDNGLIVLSEVLRLITLKWPDVVFLSSSELAGMIRGNYRDVLSFLGSGENG